MGVFSFCVLCLLVKSSSHQQSDTLARVGSKARTSFMQTPRTYDTSVNLNVISTRPGTLPIALHGRI